MTVPAWALSLAFWLHMLATVVWIGGLAGIILFLLPAVGESQEEAVQAQMLAKVIRRLDPLAWFSLLLLVGTGLVQMTASPRYQGFLAISNTWALAILLKHLLFLGMVGVSAYLTWGTLPAYRREMLRQAKGRETAELPRLYRRNLLLLRLNLGLGLIVLGMTALARALV